MTYASAHPAPAEPWVTEIPAGHIDTNFKQLYMNVRKAAPDVIYLQWVGDDADNLTPDELAMQPSPGDVTWCSDKQFDTDVRYVRADAPEGGN